MPAPAAIPCVTIPPRTPPPAHIINAMAMQMVHELNGAIIGIVPFARGEQPLPKAITQEKMLVGFAMSVHSSLTHLATRQEDGTNEAPARFGDVLLSASPRSLNKRWRKVRSHIDEVLRSEDWTLLGDHQNFRSRKAGRFLSQVLDLMEQTRIAYIGDAAERTEKLTPKQREQFKEIPAEADMMSEIASMPEGQKSAIIAAVISGKTLKEAMAGIVTVH